MSAQRAAEMQAVLEGVPLPAKKRQLIDYARDQDEAAAAELQRLPDREYRSLDDVGEALAPVQPERPHADPPKPHEESGEPPGGDDYVEADPKPGTVRHDAPPGNPPQKALEQQTKTQKKQQKRQQELG